VEQSTCHAAEERALQLHHLMRNLIPSILLVLASTSTTFADAHGHYRDRGRANRTPLRMSTDAFRNNRALPVAYTCDGASAAPRLSWTRAPERTQSLAFIVFDPDAPGGQFTHWLVTDISPDTQAIVPGGDVPYGARVERNSSGSDNWIAPCPTGAGDHHYIFRVYALDIPLRHVDKDNFMSAIQGHILAEGEMVGMYHRQHGRAMRRHRY
jgi:hypothetical protein